MSIGRGLWLYMMDNGRPAPDLPSLIDPDLLAPKTLVCPGTGTEPAATTRPADLASHCDYVYVAGLKDLAPHEMVWAFELPANHGQEAANALYADGHVGGFVFYPSAGRQGRQAYLDLIQRTNEHLAARRRAGP
jgi:prepilin-type processing-associated H-X9-DG protein